MIITKTPFRISFVGGGTDFPIWYKEHGGSVISTTINKFCYVSVRYLPSFFEYKSRIVYSNIELVSRLDEIKHPSVRETLRYLKVDRGVEIHHDGDLPARSGLGSSSSFTVGLIHALKALDGRIIDKESLYLQALDIEQNHIKEACGSQDQVAAAHGGFNRINFHQDGSIDVKPLVLRPRTRQELEKGLALFFTGVSRTANDLEIDKQNRLKEIAPDLAVIGTFVEDAYKELSSLNFTLKNFGDILHETWQYKKKLSPMVSNSSIDDAYEKARRKGAHGGKILGAGGGGFLLLCCEPWQKDRLIEAMHPFVHVPFKFEYEGSKVALYTPNGL